MIMGALSAIQSTATRRLVLWAVSVALAGYLTGAYVDTAYGTGKFAAAAGITVLVTCIGAASVGFLSTAPRRRQGRKTVAKALARSALLLYPTLIVAFYAVHRVCPPRLLVPAEGQAVLIVGLIFVPLALLFSLAPLLAWLLLREDLERKPDPS
jgi:hypothetical protein